MVEYDESIWYNDVFVLTKNVNNLWPTHRMTLNEQINALTRSLLIVTAIGYSITSNATLLITGLLFIFMFAVYGYAKKHGFIEYGFLKNSFKEGFANVNDDRYENLIKERYESHVSGNGKHFEDPTPTNPFSNVLLTQIHDEPNRKPAPPAFLKNVEEEIHENVRQMVRNEHPDIKDIDKRMFTEVGDNFTFDRGLRQFYSTANTQIPNDQKGFAEFCYGGMISCKEGNEIACEQKAFRHRPGY